MNEKHFEDVWVAAEKVAEEYYENKSEQANKDISEADDLFISPLVGNPLVDEQLKENMGKALLALCYFSKKYNIDVWSALREATNNAKLDLLDPEISEN